MRTAILASQNKNKIKEIRGILDKYDLHVISRDDAGIPMDDIEETGTTFEQNSMLKASVIMDMREADPELKKYADSPVIADDSGLMVDALGGRPGVYSARYAPKDQLCSKLLGELRDVPEEERGAYFCCTIAYIDENGSGTVAGKCEGMIGYEERGTNGFGYDPVFVYGDKTLAEMTAEEKNAISHRGAAMRQLCEVFRERYGETHADK